MICPILIFLECIPCNFTDKTIKNIDGRNNLKSYFYRSLPKKISYIYMYSRRIKIMFARIRMQCSELLYHLYQSHVANSPNCPCNVVETPEHYFHDCPLHHIARV